MNFTARLLKFSHQKAGQEAKFYVFLHSGCVQIMKISRSSFWDNIKLNFMASVGNDPFQARTMIT